MVQAIGQTSGKTLSVQINLGGVPMPDDFEVLSVKTHHGVNLVPEATVVIAGGDVASGTFSLSEASVCKPATDIEIQAGYDSKLKTIFKGVVTRQGIKAFAEGPSMSLTCQDKAASLKKAGETTEFHDMKDSDAITALFKRFGLQADVEPTAACLTRATINGETAWDYVLRRADFNGMIVTLKEGKATVAPPAFAAPAWSATYGDDILELNVDLDGASQLSQVNAQAWAPSQQSSISAKATEPEVNKQGNLTGLSLSNALSRGGEMLTTHAPLGEHELKTWADARLIKSRLSRFTGTVRVPGQPAIWPGDQLSLAGLGERFDGNGFVSAIAHDIANGNWTTVVTLGLDANAFPVANPHPSDMAITGGLQIAKVVKTDSDPQNEGRIKVVFPLNTNNENGAWVRLASPYASQKAGFEFLPEIGDEIVVGFLGGDPDAGVMIGALHSSARPASVVPNESNSTKSIISRSQLKMSFDDDDRVVQIETPGGHVVTLSDKDMAVTVSDSNGNTMAMTEGGIALTSLNDVTITAGKQLSLAAQNGISINTPSDVKISGANTEINADMSAKVSGGASTTLQSSGTTEVSGAMVMIN